MITCLVTYIYWGGGGAGQSLPYPMLTQYRKFSALILEYFELCYIVLIFMAKGYRNAAWSQLYSKLQAESDNLPGEVTKYLMVFSHHVEGEIN